MLAAAQRTPRDDGYCCRERRLLSAAHKRWTPVAHRSLSERSCSRQPTRGGRLSRTDRGAIGGLERVLSSQRVAAWLVVVERAGEYGVLHKFVRAVLALSNNAKPFADTDGNARVHFLGVIHLAVRQA